ncbi:Pimeloyl-ACP methyl ester carboxylesterase [Faunimonas pinastri]|uniref:Pimeloyl-ACP methyl ester carboxylesterase n=1 Tax=Faunimonas pinastri TaxID=1855383 RepID=A0A1H9KLV4_9HYPH|nr:alpha/beta hydrolase [Faunimonas pinastri]SER00124.1 Pimeloyl-ACP methyl ester carboxylesterase [Faunimonas pinastri]
MKSLVRTVLLLSLVGIGMAGLLARAAAEPETPRPRTSGYADVNGVRLYYEIYGKGRPVILLHGGLGDSRAWVHLIPALDKNWQVIALDSRGHGQSSWDGKIGYDLMSSDVVGFMDELKIPKASIVGWSDGGIIGLDLAIRHPDRLEKLFAFGANYNTDGLILHHPDAPIPPAPDLSATIAESGRPAERELSREDLVQAVKHMWRTEPNFSPAELGAVTTPTIIADGEHDQAIKQEHTVEMAHLIPGARLLLIPDAGHAAMLERPEVFNEAVIAFLRGNEPAPAERSEPRAPTEAGANAVPDDAPVTH